MDNTAHHPPRHLQDELGKKNPFDLLEEEVYLNLVKSAEHLSGQVKALLAEHGLSEPLYNALRIIAARGQAGIPSQSIARDMVCRSPDMTSLVDRLCQAGLVDRQRHPEDRRVILVCITPKGVELLRKIKRPAVRRLVELMRHMDRATLAALNPTLFALRHPPPPRGQAARPTGR